MKVNVNIDFGKILKKQKTNARRRLEKFAEIVRVKINEKTPEDTQELLGNTTKTEVIEVGNKMYIKAYNDTEYAYYVEYGVQGKIFNYKKGGKVFYTGVGVGMFGKTVEELEGKFEILTN